MKGRTSIGLRDPLLLKELRTRMRSRAAVIIATLYVIAMALGVFWTYLTAGGLNHALGSQIGSAILRLVSSVQLWIVIIVLPLFTASAITSEKDQKTFDSLSVAPVGVGRLVVAKYVASLSYFVALLLISLPLISVSFILGGVSPVAIGVDYLLTFGAMLFVGSAGLYYSCRFERSVASIPAAGITVTGGALLARPFLSGLAIDFSGFAALGPGDGFIDRSWAPSLLLLALGAAYLLRAAVIRLHFPSERRYVLLRLLGLMFLIVLFAFVAFEKITGGGYASSRPAAGALLGFILAWLALCAPWIGANHAASRSESGATPGNAGALPRMLRGLMLNGARFVFVVLLAATAVVEIALRVGVDKLRPCGLRLVCCGIVALAGLSWTTLGGWLSGRRTVARKWVGIGSTYVLVLAALFVPKVLVYILRNQATGAAPVPVQYLSLLSPTIAIDRLSLGSLRYTGTPALEDLPGGVDAIWIALALQAAALALVSLAAWATLRRRPNLNAER